MKKPPLCVSRDRLSHEEPSGSDAGPRWPGRRRTGGPQPLVELRGPDRLGVGPFGVLGQQQAFGLDLSRNGARLGPVGGGTLIGADETGFGGDVGSGGRFGLWERGRGPGKQPGETRARAGRPAATAAEVVGAGPSSIA